MKKSIADSYENENFLLDLIEISNNRFLEIEICVLISDFHKIMSRIFNNQLDDKLYVRVYVDIEKYCINRLKDEYKKAQTLDLNQFMIWHLSLFMAIQTFIETVSSKYNLKYYSEIEQLFDDILDTDFYDFIDMNSEKRGIPNFKNKLLLEYQIVSNEKDYSLFTPNLIKKWFLPDETKSKYPKRMNNEIEDIDVKLTSYLKLIKKFDKKIESD